MRQSRLETMLAVMEAHFVGKAEPERPPRPEQPKPRRAVRAGRAPARPALPVQPVAERKPCADGSFAHHWRIDPPEPDVPVLVGRCVRPGCGAVRTFTKEVADVGDWNNDEALSLRGSEIRLPGFSLVALEE